MTPSSGPGLDKCGAAAALTGPARDVHRAVLAGFAGTGRAPAREELKRIAGSHGADPDAVLAELAGRDLLAFTPDGQIRAAYPFSPVPTPISVSWPGGPAAYAMCAIDALGVSAMLGRLVTITAPEPGTGRVITVETDGARAQWRPGRAVVFAGATADECGAAADRSCGYINFFTSARAARQWAKRHPAITGTVLDQAEALAQGIAEFGAFLQNDNGETSPDPPALAHDPQHQHPVAGRRQPYPVTSLAKNNPTRVASERVTITLVTSLCLIRCACAAASSLGRTVDTPNRIMVPAGACHGEERRPSRYAAPMTTYAWLRTTTGPKP